MAGGRAAPEYSAIRIVGVDEEGVERGIDYRAWQPMAFDELMPWMHRTFPRLPRPSQDRVAAHLLDKAEAAPAAKKAFIANRVGDWGFVMGILLLFWMTSGAGAPSISFFIPWG